MYLCISHFPKILWCVLTLYTVESHRSSRGESSNSSSDSQCDHKGTTPVLEEISKGFSVLTSLMSNFCLVYSQTRETLQKDQGNKDKVKQCMRRDSYSQLQCIGFLTQKVNYGYKKVSYLPVTNY